MITKKFTIVVEARTVNFRLVKMIEALGLDGVKFISFNEETITR